MWTFPSIFLTYFLLALDRIGRVVLWYTSTVHKPIYASGFLYHPTTHQILLQQAIVLDDSVSPLDMFSGVSHDREDSRATFARVILESLHVELKDKYIFPVYDYVSNDVHHKNVFVFYGQVRKLEAFPSGHGKKYQWLTFKQMTKISLDEQAKQDLMVSERVIHAAERTKAAIHVEPPHIHFPKLLRALSR